MPGLSVAIGDTTSVRPDATAALDATRFLEGYLAETALSTDGAWVGRTAYEGYPIRRVETDHGTAFLEGYLYDVDDPEAHLERVARLVAEGKFAALADWVGRRDGDFLLVVERDDAVAVLNDPFARLPAYYATVEGTRVCSRELGFVREFARRRGAPLELDRLALGQQLLLGYPLGDRTPFEAVRTVPPGSLVRFEGGATTVRHLYEHDFDSERNAERTVEENADALADRLVAACRNRSLAGRPSVVSLSGGLDSRTVAAAYSAAGLDPIAASFQRGDASTDREVAAAGAVADVLDLDWRSYSLESTEARRETLLETKQGLNYLGMAYVLEFFERLRAEFDAPVHVTGDGGDKVLVDLTPSTRPVSFADLLEYTVSANSRLSLADAADLVDVDEVRLRESVADRLRSYPESDLSRKYVHFLVRERGVNYLVHGEDRNRYYAWSVAPFYSLPVFEYAMECPVDQKQFRRLHVAILERFEPALLDVTYPNFGAPVTSTRYRVKQFVYDFLERYPALQSAVVGLVTDEGGDTAEVAASLRRQLPDLEGAPIDSQAVARVVADHAAYSPMQLEILATATALAVDVLADVGEAPERPATAPGGDR